MRATLRRLSSHAPKLSPELWSSESFAKRVQTLRENVSDKQLYPLTARGVKVTPIREFVRSFENCMADQLATAGEKRYTLNGTG